MTTLAAHYQKTNVTQVGIGGKGKITRFFSASILSSSIFISLEREKVKMKS